MYTEKSNYWGVGVSYNHEVGPWFLRKETFSTATFSTPWASVFS